MCAPSFLTVRPVALVRRRLRQCAKLHGRAPRVSFGMRDASPPKQPAGHRVHRVHIVELWVRIAYIMKIFLDTCQAFS
jgi:hypothetical protein